MWDVWKLFAGHTARVGDHHGVKVTPGAHQSQLHEMQMGRIMAAHRGATVTAAAKRQRPRRLYLTTSIFSVRRTRRQWPAARVAARSMQRILEGLCGYAPSGWIAYCDGRQSRDGLD